MAPQKRGESTEFKFFTPLVLKNIPPSMAITSDPPQSVNVHLRVPRYILADINSSQFQVVMDLSNQLPGRFNYTLDVRNVTYRNEKVPDGVEILQVSPVQIPLTLEEMVSRRVPLRAKYSGTLAKGYEIERIRMIPSTLELMGPRTRMERVKEVFIKPLDLQDLNASVEMLAVPDLPPLFRLANPNEQFMAEVAVVYMPQRVNLQNIPVLFENAAYSWRANPTHINAKMIGPAAVVRLMNEKNVVAVVDLKGLEPGEYKGLEPQLELPPYVRILRQWPKVDVVILKSKRQP
ncbi:MAG: CdaR family protein [Deltaproteobacteria bacterium]|nr:CdaR family protein [Deltaproteobacteria bacterium]